MMTRQKQAYLYAFGVVAIWSTVASAFKITLRYVDFVHLVFFAILVSLAVFFVIVLFQKKLKLISRSSRHDFFSSALLGFLNPFVYYLVLFKAYSLLPAQEAQPLNQTWVILLAVFSIIILKQRITLKSIGAIAISFFGVVIVTTHGNFLDIKFTSLSGTLLALGSAFIWAIFWIYNIKDTRDAVVKLFLNFLFGFTFIFLYLVATRQLHRPSLPGLLGSAYVGVFEMGITFVLWLKALQLSRTTAQVGHLIYLIPFISLIIIHFSVGETILVSTVIGLVFIISGIILQQYATRRTPS